MSSLESTSVRASSMVTELKASSFISGLKGLTLPSKLKSSFILAPWTRGEYAARNTER